METLLPKIFSKIVKMIANVLFLNQHVHTIIEVKTKSVHLELIIIWSRALPRCEHSISVWPVCIYLSES